MWTATDSPTEDLRPQQEAAPWSSFWMRHPAWAGAALALILLTGVSLPAASSPTAVNPAEATAAARGPVAALVAAFCGAAMPVLVVVLVAVQRIRRLRE